MRPAVPQFMPGLLGRKRSNAKQQLYQNTRLPKQSGFYARQRSGTSPAAGRNTDWSYAGSAILLTKQGSAGACHILHRSERPNHGLRRYWTTITCCRAVCAFCGCNWSVAPYLPKLRRSVSKQNDQCKSQCNWITPIPLTDYVQLAM